MIHLRRKQWQWHQDFSTHHNDDGVPEPLALNLHIFLDDVTVSRRHAEFRSDGGDFQVVDVGSLNGTYVNKTLIDGDVALRRGDEVLVQFAAILRLQARFIDHVGQAPERTLGRFGGEEFMIILPGTGLAGARVCLERMRAAVAQAAEQLCGHIRLAGHQGLTDGGGGGLGARGDRGGHRLSAPVLPRGGEARAPAGRLADRVQRRDRRRERGHQGPGLYLAVRPIRKLRRI